MQMIRMSTGHMEGNLQLIYVLLTDCYVYLIRKGISPRQPLGSAAGREAPSMDWARCLHCQFPCVSWSQ